MAAQIVPLTTDHRQPRRPGLTQLGDPIDSPDLEFAVSIIGKKVRLLRLAMDGAMSSDRDLLGEIAPLRDLIGDIEADLIGLETELA